jgi:hypothetical protein
VAMWGPKKEEPKDAWQREHEAKHLEKLLPIITLCQTRAQNVANFLRTEFARSGRPLTQSGENVIFTDAFLIVVNFARASAGISSENGRYFARSRQRTFERVAQSAKTCTK